MNYIAIIFILYSIIPILHAYKKQNVSVAIWILLADIWAYQAIGML